MKTFVILSPGFPADENESTCLPAIQHFVLCLKRNYPDVNFVIITFQYPYQKKEYFWHSIKVISIGGANKSGINRLLTWLNVYKTLNKIRKVKGEFSLLSLWLSECALVGKFYGKLNHMKHYVWLQGQDAKTSNQYVKMIRPKANELIAISDFIQEEVFKNHGIKPFLVAQNGVNEESFPDFNSGDRKIDVLGVGSLTSLKNYSLFLDIISEIGSKIPELNVVIVGIGEEENMLKEKVKSLNLQNNVTFAGQLSHPEVFKLMSNSKAFLHTSSYEGNSTVLIEALYSGCFVVSTQPLSNLSTKNLTVTTKKEELINGLLMRLLDTETRHERIIFNKMDDTAKKIFKLYS